MVIPLLDQLSARHQREPHVVDIGRITEGSWIQIGWLDGTVDLPVLRSLAFPRLSLVRGGHIQ